MVTSGPLVYQGIVVVKMMVLSVARICMANMLRSMDWLSGRELA